jgi:hypothetical protein
LTTLERTHTIGVLENDFHNRITVAAIDLEDKASSEATLEALGAVTDPVRRGDFTGGVRGLS